MLTDSVDQEFEQVQVQQEGPIPTANVCDPIWENLTVWGCVCSYVGGWVGLNEGRS